MNSLEARKKLIQMYYTLKSFRKTAARFHTSRIIVRKFVRRYEKEGVSGLEDKSRRPKHCPRQISSELEALVIKYRKKTNMGRLELSNVIRREEKKHISPNTIRNVLRRNKMTRKKRKRAKYGKSLFIDYQYLKELQYFQIDTKEILDYKALPKKAYRNIMMRKLAKFQFTAIDVKTRIKFIAYAKEKNQINGRFFMMLVAFWLRLYKINHKLYFQTDWGQEFGGFSIRKLDQLQKKYFTPMGIEHWHSRKGKWWDNAFVERSHLTDDQLLYVPYGADMKSDEDLLSMARKYMYYYNKMRVHMGKGMNMTPYHKLKNSDRFKDLPLSVIKFPIVVLDKFAVDFYLEFDKLITSYPGNDVLANDFFYNCE